MFACILEARGMLFVGISPALGKSSATATYFSQCVSQVWVYQSDGIEPYAAPVGENTTQ